MHPRILARRVGLPVALLSQGPQTLQLLLEAARADIEELGQPVAAVIPGALESGLLLGHRLQGKHLGKCSQRKAS